jgi:glutamate N-acetyltransferase/amino-acid N-acetyltransferase
VIGVPLPIDKAEAGLDAAFTAEPCGWEDAAATIMTTDTFAKAAVTSAVIGDRTVSLVGIVKGSGMIAPDMATMLGFIFTDAAVAPGLLQAMLGDANRQAASRASPSTATPRPATPCSPSPRARRAMRRSPPDDAGADAFHAALPICAASLPISSSATARARRSSSRSPSTGAEATPARIASRSIANSPLVKTAIAGEDANWGRVVMAVGKAGEPAERDRLVDPLRRHPGRA